MKKLLLICLLAMVAIFGAACASPETPPAPPVPEEEAAPPPLEQIPEEETAEPLLEQVPGEETALPPLEQAPSVAKYTLPAFSALDIYGEAVDSDIFADYDLTMLNIWGTFCGPCIMEMPDLGEMAAAMPEGTQLVGLVGDALDAQTIELAQTIAETTGAAYPHIVPNKELYDYLYRNIAFFPTTLFIDSKGNTVGEPLIGAMNRVLYEAELKKRLKML